VAQAKAAMMADPEMALKHSSAALAAARGAGVDKATAQWLRGEALLRMNRLSEAAPAIAEGLAIAEARARNTKLHGDLRVAQGALLATQGKVQSALEDFQAAYRIFQAAQEPRSQAMALQNIGAIYQDAGDFPKVMQYYAQSAELVKDDPALLVTAFNNVGNALREQKKFPEAIAELQRARALAREMQSPFLEAHVLGNLASTEVMAGRLQAAERHIDEGLRLSRADPAAAEWRPFLWGVAAQAAHKRGRLDEAAVHLENTFAGADLATTTVPYRDFHRSAYEVYEARGDNRRALAHLKAWKRLDDEVRALAASTNAALMSARFDFANQSSRIAQLKAGQLERDIKLARSRNTVTIVLLVASLVVAVLLTVAVLWIRRSRNLVRAANRQLNVLNITLQKALSARTEFLATTSHEIRTPLNGILGMTEVLLRQRDLDPALREKIGVVHGAGETMRALVDDILDVAKIESGRLVISPIEMDLGELLRETAQLWSERARSKGVELVLDVAEAPGQIVEDPSRLRQIVFNLMSNAIKFTHQGSVTLQATVETLEEGEQLLLRVADTGIGIPAEKLGDIFDSFSQVDGSTTRVYGGTGLGLSICRSLTAAMGGNILVESVVGEGSTFEVRLPLTRAAAVASSEEPAPTEFSQARLLLLDANPLSQAVVRAIVQPKVRALECVATSDEALVAFGGGCFDIVLADAASLADTPAERPMAARELAVTIAPAALVVTAAGVTDKDVGDYLRAGVAQLVRKPIAAPTLLAELKAGFDGRLAQAAGRSAAG
jgi:signal transduction histidine kinase